MEKVGSLGSIFLSYLPTEHFVEFQSYSFYTQAIAIWRTLEILTPAKL